MLKRAGKKQERPAFTFIDLFAGIGGMRMGFEAVGGECIFSCEWNKFARETYVANFGNHPYPDAQFPWDITKVDEMDVPQHDILVAGFPCQPFSLAGVSKKNSLGRKHGFLDETQGTLFFDICRILKARQPKAFLLENVKNLASHDRGRTIEVILRKLRELGYVLGDAETDYRILDAQLWVPQHRERTFIVGYRMESGFSWNDLVVPTSTPKLGGILHPENGSETTEEPFTLGSEAKVNTKYTLTPKLWKYLKDYKKKHQRLGNGFGFGLFGKEDVARTLSARYHKDGSEILISRGPRARPRRLTPRECSRLMGFDPVCQEVYGRDLIIPVSDTQAYRQFGNAVAVPVIKAIAKCMRSALVNKTTTKQPPQKPISKQEEFDFKEQRKSA